MTDYIQGEFPANDFSVSLLMEFDIE